MNKILNSKEKICAFYASDYHFEMMSLPYIDQKLENGYEIVILTEKNLQKTVQVLLSKINIKEDKKKKIIDLNWQNEDSKKIEKIGKNIEENKDLIIFVKGDETYMKNVNKKIELLIQEQSNVKIINCFDINDIGENVGEIMSSYKKILNTSGEKEI